MTIKFGFGVSCYKSGPQRLMGGSLWEFSFASCRVTMNTKEGIGTILHQYIWHSWRARISKSVSQEKRSEELENNWNGKGAPHMR